MTRALFLLFTGLCIAAAQAQPVPAAVDTSPEVIARERSRIEAERRREETRFATEEGNCYQRFAVNDCLREMNVRRRAVFEDLRRQEVELNDAERRQRGAEQLRRTEDRMSPRAQQEEAERREAGRQDQRERAKRAEDKRGERAQADAARVPRAAREPASASGPDNAAQAENRRLFEEKQRQARERKIQRDKALAEKGDKPPVQPLPAKAP